MHYEIVYELCVRTAMYMMCDVCRDVVMPQHILGIHTYANTCLRRLVLSAERKKNVIQLYTCGKIKMKSHI